MAQYPSLEKIFYYEKDRIASEVLLFVNGQSVQGDITNTPVKDGDEIYPVILIGGG